MDPDLRLSKNNAPSPKYDPKVAPRAHHIHYIWTSAGLAREDAARAPDLPVQNSARLDEVTFEHLVPKACFASTPSSNVGQLSSPAIIIVGKSFGLISFTWLTVNSFYPDPFF